MRNVIGFCSTTSFAPCDKRIMLALFWPIEADNVAGRRKASEALANSVARSAGISVANTDPDIPFWIEDQQTVSVFPASATSILRRVRTLLISHQYSATNSSAIEETFAKRIIFPLSTDHLITLLQFNVLRACITNRLLIPRRKDQCGHGCSKAAMHVSPVPSYPQEMPESLYPTLLQRTIPHEEWIDIIPHPRWRDNLLLAIGTFDEGALWSDTIGGLFEGFPDSEVEHRGIIAWSPPWHFSGYEVTEGFLRRWGWSFKGCEDALETTNMWRSKRGEEPLVLEV
jgi:hypothetical protein